MGELSLTHYYTPAEYFEIDENSDFRYEYIDGEMVAMAGTSMNHNEISANILVSFRAGIKQAGRKCKTFMSDIRFYVGSKNSYFYPDVMITCSEKDFKDGRNAEEAVLVVEVLSDSTQRKDLSLKLHAYMQVPSLQYYLVIDQDKPLVHVYQRSQNDWLISLFDSLEQVIELPVLSISISLQAIYENIEWA